MSYRNIRYPHRSTVELRNYDHRLANRKWEAYFAGDKRRANRLTRMLGAVLAERNRRTS